MFQSLGSILFVIFSAPCVMLNVSSQRADHVTYIDQYIVLEEDYPYVVGIDILQHVQPKKIERFCTGTYLFEHNYILTAAHCVVTEDRKSVAENGAVSIVYNNGRGENFSHEPKTTNPKKIIVHPEYLKTRDSAGQLLKPFDICILVSERELRGGMTLPLGWLPSVPLMRQHLIQAQANEEPCMWIHYSLYIINTVLNRYKLIARPVTLVPHRVCEKEFKESGVHTSEETHLCTTYPEDYSNKRIECDMFGGSPLVCFRWPGVIGVFISAEPCNAPSQSYEITTVAERRKAFLLFARVDHSMGFLEKNLANVASGTAGGSDSATTESGASYIYPHTGIIYVILCSSWTSGIET